MALTFLAVQSVNSGDLLIPGTGQDRVDRALLEQGGQELVERRILCPRIHGGVVRRLGLEKGRDIEIGGDRGREGLKRTLGRRRGARVSCLHCLWRGLTARGGRGLLILKTLRGARLRRWGGRARCLNSGLFAGGVSGLGLLRGLPLAFSL